MTRTRKRGGSVVTTTGYIVAVPYTDNPRRDIPTPRRIREWTREGMATVRLIDGALRRIARGKPSYPGTHIDPRTTFDPLAPRNLSNAKGGPA